jgi:hypothetical protein
MEFRSERKFTYRENHLIVEVIKYFTEEKLCSILIPLLEQRAPISLRGIDWLITNFSKKFNIICCGKNKEFTNIFHSYKRALSFYKRRHFDPFRRRTRVFIKFSDGKEIETTIGQVVFLMWADRLNVLQYAYNHAEEIEADMNKCTSQLRTERKQMMIDGKVRRRKELSLAPISHCIVYSKSSK